MKGFCAAARLLPPDMERAAMAMPEADKRRCEEFRLRAGRPATVLLGGEERALGGGPVGEEAIRCVLEAASRASLHSLADQLRGGYLSAEGGVRVGICGTAVMGSGGLEGLVRFSSLVIRVPRAVPGCEAGIWPALTEGGFSSSLLVSPPGGGKTTLLRELIRRLSESGVRVGVADERREIAGCSAGVPGFDVGPHTDVLTGAPKALAVRMLLRAMNPQVIAVDEVADRGDAEALLEAAGCGVGLLATVHGSGPEDVARRAAGRLLLESGVFFRLVTVESRNGERRYRVETLPCG